MNRFIAMLLWGCANAFGGRALETVLPGLVYEGGCSSVVELRNLGEAEAAVDVEVHRADGTLAGVAGIRMHLAAGETVRRRVEGTWVKIREVTGARHEVGVQASVDCREGETVRTAVREAAYPARNPWFAGDGDGSILMINTSERESTASLCYSAGAEYSVPGRPFQPVCLVSFDVQVPALGTRVFEVRREGSTHFELRTAGEKIVLQMLRKVAGSERMFAVDSSISFGR